MPNSAAFAPLREGFESVSVILPVSYTEKVVVMVLPNNALPRLTGPGCTGVEP